MLTSGLWSLCKERARGRPQEGENCFLDTREDILGRWNAITIILEWLVGAHPHPFCHQASPSTCAKLSCSTPFLGCLERSYMALVTWLVFLEWTPYPTPIPNLYWTIFSIWCKNIKMTSESKRISKSRWIMKKVSHNLGLGARAVVGSLKWGQRIWQWNFWNPGEMKQQGLFLRPPSQWREFQSFSWAQANLTLLLPHPTPSIWAYSFRPL